MSIGFADQDRAMLALDTAQHLGASYADIRLIQEQHEAIAVKNGEVSSVDISESVGFGVRVILNGAWGFAASAEDSKDSIEKTAKLAVQIARASSRVKVEDIHLSPLEKQVADWATPVEIDPFQVPLHRKIDLLLEADAAIRRVKGVKIAQSAMEFWDKAQVFASTEGSFIRQRIVHSGGGIEATAVKEGEIQRRSYPSSFGGQHASRGYELVKSLDLPAHGEQIGEEAVALLAADQCPIKTTSLILEGSQLALQIHESCGHPIELDRVFGSEANYAGTSFLTPDQLNVLQYGSPIVRIVADATWNGSPGGLGTFGYDDEGVPAQCVDIVKEGLFVGYLTSRETAPKIGQCSGGAMRADGWSRIPLIRMTNVSLLPGEGTLEDLIAGTDDGIYMATNRSWSIDDRRLNFQFGTEIGWEIKHGKLGRMLKNPTYTGITPEFWNACNAIAGADEWMIWGVPNCGKGQPGQTARTGHGAAPARFRNVQVGVGYA